MYKSALRSGLFITYLDKVGNYNICSLKFDKFTAQDIMRPMALLLPGTYGSISLANTASVTNQVIFDIMVLTGFTHVNRNN